MPRGPGYPAEVRNAAVSEYLAGRATMPVIARELGVTTATISRWVATARQRGLPTWHPEAHPADQPNASNHAPLPTQAGDLPITPTPPSLASRVAELAPPPAPPKPPAITIGDGSAGAMASALETLILRLTDQVERAQAQADPRVATQALSAALNAMREIRQHQRSLAEDGDALSFTREQLDAARVAFRARVEALGPLECPHCGAELRRMWALGADVPTSGARNTDASHVTGVTPPKGKPGA